MTNVSSTKREYRKGNPRTQKDYNDKHRDKKLSNNNKELRVFIPADLKDRLASYCKENNITQSAYLEYLLNNAL
ncbi:RepB family protein [Proteus mirabilis]|uniref:RepB family protein n=1 Tax=Proteus mirabilis TaxID=584 RepID=UPI001A29D845|nr:RepB family protein [Proteus mirabilis]HEM8286008.1 hypothetical protein [Providencia stuartii]EKU3803924.1 hypothetical protein [Proteus mirabilis]EKV7963167.1 hypothetical protein [Proteus mirabilis]ELB1171896.1 hypothetical protein [Proteus mirabilis]ELB2631255.1 hypothetical protein [Proteus mirabilis]